MDQPYSYLKIEDIFKPGEDFFRVPPYQRGYTWEADDQVSKFMADLLEAYDADSSEDYLLGQIILCPSPQMKGYVDIVDGQQRLTTSFLLLLAGYKSIKSSEEELDTTSRKLFEGFSNKLYYADEATNFPTRIQVSAGGETVIKSIIDDNKLPVDDEVQGHTQENLLSAYTLIQKFLEENFDTKQQIFNFVKYVNSKVRLMALNVKDTNQALKIFARVNNRGMSLDDADLIKNLLFQEVSPRDYERISDEWNAAAGKMFSTRLKRTRSMNFLLKNMIGIRTGESIRVDDLFERWEKEFKKSKELYNLPEDSEFSNFEPITPSEFAKMLPTDASQLVKISKGEKPQGGFYKANQNGIFTFAYTQPYEVLLSASNKDEETFDIIARVVEARTMLSLLSEEKTQDYERMVHKWAFAIRKIPYTSSFDEVLEASDEARKNLPKLLDLMELNIRGLSYEVPGQQKRIRYILARIAFHVQQDIFKSTQSELRSIEELMLTSKSRKSDSASTTGFHIEHIFPKSLRQRDKFSDSEKISLIHKIGNLTLLNPFDNEAVKDMLPSETDKQNNFVGSNLFINKMLVAATRLENNVSRVTLEILKSEKQHLNHDLDNWDAAAIEDRQNYLIRTFRSLIEKDLGL